MSCNDLITNNIFQILVEGDDLRNEDRDRAIEMFEKVVKMESDMGETVKW